MTSSWWNVTLPWIQGLFGGAGAILLWEAFWKPARERRSLAHVLAEEVALNLQYAAGQRLYSNKNTKGIPGDFALFCAVFAAVAARVGELPELAGEIVLFYQRVDALNRIPQQWAAIVAEYNDTSGPDIAVSARRRRAEQELAALADVYRTGLEKLVEAAGSLLPKLRRSSRAWYRPDLAFRKPKLLDLNEVAEAVDRLHAHREAAIRASAPHPEPPPPAV